MTAVAVIAKACIPGRVKTRLTPPLTPEQAAELATASLADTLDAVSALPSTRRILFFDGDISSVPTEARGYEVIAQPSGGLDERLAYLFDLVDEPLLLVGMDTPQITADLLAPALALGEADPEAWFGAAADGGFWALAMAAPDGSLIRGVPMSLATTGADQLRRLTDAGLRIGTLPELIDVDHIAEAETVAALVPNGRFATVLQSIAASDTKSRR